MTKKIKPGDDRKIKPEDDEGTVIPDLIGNPQMQVYCAVYPPSIGSSVPVI